MRSNRTVLASCLPPLLVGLQSLFLASCDAGQPLRVQRTSSETTQQAIANDWDHALSLVLSVGDSTLAIGEHLQLSAIPVRADGTPLTGVAVSWTSSDPSVIAISRGGLASGQSSGSAVITAASSGITRSVTMWAGDSVPQNDTLIVAPGDTVPAAPGDSVSAPVDGPADGSGEGPVGTPLDSTSGQPTTPATPSGPAGPWNGSATIAALPRASVNTAYPVGGNQVRVPAGTSLQAAIDAAQPGDELLLPAGSVWTGNFTLPDKGGSSWIVIRTDVSDAALGSQGTRMTPSRSASLGLARIVTPSNQPAISTELGAHHYRLTGVEISATGGRDVYSLLDFGRWSAQQTAATMAYDLILDRSYVHGLSNLNLRRCVNLNSATSAVIDSWLGECHSNMGDSQAISGINGPGPFLIENNTLESGHQAFMFGGGDPTIQGLVPSDITIRGNHMTRPAAWKNVWQTKTIAETKNARRVLLEGNVIENVWADAQVGYAILFKSSNQDGGCTWCTTSDITFRYNRIRNVAAVFNIAARPELYPAVPAARFTIHDNLTDNVNVGQFNGPGIGLQVIGDVQDIIFAHNTTIAPSGNSATMFDGNPNTRFVMHSNLLSHGQYGVFGSGKGVGKGAIAFYTPNALFANNTMIGGNCKLYPAGTSCPLTLALVGFVNSLLGDYRLGLPSVLRALGYDGQDVGADVAKVSSATMGVIVAP
jgi:hypothetical protein